MTTSEFKETKCGEIFATLKTKGYQPDERGCIYIVAEDLIRENEDFELMVSYEEYDKFTETSFPSRDKVVAISSYDDSIIVDTDGNEVDTEDMTCEDIDDLSIDITNLIPEKK